MAASWLSWARASPWSMLSVLNCVSSGTPWARTAGERSETAQSSHRHALKPAMLSLGWDAIGLRSHQELSTGWPSGLCPYIDGNGSDGKPVCGSNCCEMRDPGWGLSRVRSHVGQTPEQLSRGPVYEISTMRNSWRAGDSRCLNDGTRRFAGNCAPPASGPVVCFSGDSDTIESGP